MTRRTPMLLTILAFSLVLFFSTGSSAEEVIELTNESVVAYEQPCYNRATTREFVNGDDVTYCDITPNAITCAGEEPTWCEE